MPLDIKTNKKSRGHDTVQAVRGLKKNKALFIFHYDGFRVLSLIFFCLDKFYLLVIQHGCDFHDQKNATNSKRRWKYPPIA